MAQFVECQAFLHQTSSSLCEQLSTHIMSLSSYVPVALFHFFPMQLLPLGLAHVFLILTTVFMFKIFVRLGLSSVGVIIGDSSLQNSILVCSANTVVSYCDKFGLMILFVFSNRSYCNQVSSSLLFEYFSTLA